MKLYISVVKPKLMSLSTEAPLLIQDMKIRARPSYHSNNISSPPVSGCYTTAESRMNISTARQKYKIVGSKDLKPHNVSSSTNGSLLPFLAIDRSANTKHRPTSLNNMSDQDISDHHFLFDKRWRNGTYISKDTEDDVLINHKPSSPLSQEFHFYPSHNLTRFAHRKELSTRDPIKHICGSDYLTSFPSVLLPATTPSLNGRLCLSQNYKNRSSIKNRACNLFPVGADNKTQSYPDPHLGASASFVQRLTEISSLEVETVRQEKTKRLRKINRQDS